ncbi:hypothetical protein [Dysgonomonas macrotermitis]|nr:hypothetical protein [Dysgonomonas macrotermitis]
MKEAHRLMRVEGYTRSQALTLAWDKARRSEFYLIIVKREVASDYVYDENNFANTLINDYSTYGYKGD